jgi:DNA-binding NtrC family response regulator
MCAGDAFKILIVDDDSHVLESTSSLIRMWGYETVVCRNAQEAMEECLKGGICLVLSDIKMPGISGVELLGMISDINPDIKPFILAVDQTNSIGEMRC